ncbi:hypothetical protein E2650_05505 [Shewanella xiamenensis]|uniref:Uncharacterized protein n=1 Tax=Shewanella xiamenensis TaxID=332186 RepID=A0AAW6QVI7_9GAMM|nr:hypothetical protein [Shewanella xiamenensis]MDG5899367.1 hypothetical protein [Shewanella xiamenensis]
MKNTPSKTLDNLILDLQVQGLELSYLNQLSEHEIYRLANKYKQNEPQKISFEEQELINQQSKQKEAQRKQRQLEQEVKETSKYQHLGGLYRISASLAKQGLK